MVEETEEHLLNCPVLISNCPELYENIDVEYNDVFGDTVRQLAATRLYEKVLEARDKLMEQRETV